MVATNKNHNAVWQRILICATVALAIGVGPLQMKTLAQNRLSAQTALATSSLVNAKQKSLIAQKQFSEPLRFEPNQGQTDKHVQFISTGKDYSLFLTPGQAVLSLGHKSARPTAVEMTTINSNLEAKAIGLEPLPSKTNYLIGSDPANWHKNVPNFARVGYQSIYPGIDLTYYGNQKRIEYDFVVAAGADPNAIRLGFNGADKIHVEAGGELAIETKAGTLRLERPVVYQPSAHGRDSVEANYALAGNQVSFHIGAYDKSRALVIDPVIAYSTYLGSEDQNYALDSLYNFVTAIAGDAAGNVYITGITAETSFPITGVTLAVAPPAVADNPYVFIAKFSPTGELVYSTILGGSLGQNACGGIAVDNAGGVYVTGTTYASDFPVTPGAFQSGFATFSGNVSMGFVTKLNAGDSSFAYSTFLGGQTLGGASAIAVDQQGDAFVTGWDYGSFPTTPGAFQKNHPGPVAAGFGLGGPSPWVAKLQANGQKLIYGTYLGGNSNDFINAIAIDGNGDAYLTGDANSTNFPVVAPALQSALAGGQNAFVSKLNSTGTKLIYSTYLGGSQTDAGTGIAVNASGQAILVGYTSSPDFPLAAAYQSTFNTNDAFVTELNAAGNKLVYSTFLGGGTGSFGAGIALDSAGDAYVIGSTGQVTPGQSAGSPFPALNGIAINNPSGQASTFMSEFSPTGGLLNSTLFGGNTGPTYGSGVWVDGEGNSYITGTTSASDMPTTSGAQQPELAGKADVFVAKLWPLAINPYPSNLAFPNTAVGSSNSLTMLVQNTGTGTFSFSGLALNGTDADMFAETTTCGATIAAGQQCIINITFTPLSNLTYSANISWQMADGEGTLQTIFSTLTGVGTGEALALLTPPLLTFPNSEQAQTAVLSNPGNLPLGITSIAVTGPDSADFTETNNCGTSLPANSSCSIKVRFINAVNLPTGVYPVAFITVTDSVASSPQSIEVTGPAPIATLSPGTYTFPGTTQVGNSSAVEAFTLSNTGHAPLAISSIVLGGGFPGSFTETNNCGTSLAINSSCTISVSFVPTAAGTVSAYISVMDNAVVSNSVSNFTATGVAPQAFVTPTTLNFPNTAVGDSSSVKIVTLSNSGTAPMTITSISVGPLGSPSTTLAPFFSEVNNCGATLAPGASCKIGVTFVPYQAGALTNPLYITDNAPGSPQTVTLNGTSALPTVEVTPATLNFGDVPDGLAPVKDITFKNTGIVPVTLETADLGGPSATAFNWDGANCPNPLPAGASCVEKVVFRPTAQTAYDGAFTFVFNTNPANHVVALKGTGTPAAPIVRITAPIEHPLEAEFSTPMGYPSKAQTIKIANVGSATLTGFSTHLSDLVYYTIMSNSCGTTLPAGAECAVSIRFNPTNVGTFNASFTVDGNVTGLPQVVAIYGTSQALNPEMNLLGPACSFSDLGDVCYFTHVNINDPFYPITLTVQNTGNIPLTIFSITNTDAAAGPGVFTEKTNCGKFLDVGKSCTITMTFKPYFIGKVSTTLTITTDNGGNPNVSESQTLTFYGDND